MSHLNLAFSTNFCLIKIDLFDHKLQVFKNWLFLAILSSQNVNVTRTQCRMRLFLRFSNTMIHTNFIHQVWRSVSLTTTMQHQWPLKPLAILQAQQPVLKSFHGACEIASPWQTSTLKSLGCLEILILSRDWYKRNLENTSTHFLFYTMNNVN